MPAAAPPACRTSLATLLALSLGAATPTAAQSPVCTPTVQWTWNGPTASPAYPEPCITPLVVQLTDDDGDRDIDANDIPDVVFTHVSRSVYSGIITAVDGLTGREHWSTATPRIMPTALVAGDIDGDGLVEILAAADSGQAIVAFEHDGTPKWTSDPPPIPIYEFSALNIADLDQDGSPELFVGATVWGADGRLRWQGTAGTGTDSWWNLISISNAADILPLSPGLELVAGNTAYAANGTILWQNRALPDGWTAVADFDGDTVPEIVLTTREQVWLLDNQGNVRAGPVIMPGILLSQPVVGDVDGDGRPEVIAIQERELRVLEVTPTGFITRWSAAVNDDTRVNSASTFDFDGDGAAEIVYHDAEQWYIFDGRSGAVLTPFLPFVSATNIETPVIADIDHDCVSEILVSGCQGGISAVSPQQVVAYECSPSRAARPMWNQYGYHVTNVNDDGTIPPIEAPSWRAQNTWIGQIADRAGIAAEAGPARTVCARAPLDLDGSASAMCATGVTQYRWLEGPVLRCDWSLSPLCSVLPTAPMNTYTLEVSCLAQPACTDSDTVVITTRDCTLAVRFADVRADGDGDRVAVSWTTLAEERTIGFTLERAAAAAGPFDPLSGGIAAHGTGRRYRLLDPAPPTSGEIWYRVIETSDDGRGDSSPAVRATARPPAAGSTASRRSRADR